MIRHRALSGRSALEWSLRVSLALIAAALGLYSLKSTLAFIGKGNPSLAHVLAPNDGRLTALAAQALITGKSTPAEYDRAGRLARLALRQDPTAVRAATTLGLVAQIKGDTARARHLFAYAERLSRRDLQTQLWAIEDAVRRNDVPGTLRHYDIALRTSRGAPDLLFPILAAAVGDTEIRSALTRTLAAQPIWGQSFISYLAGYGSDPRASAILMKMLPRVGFPIYEEARTGIIKNLISRGFVEDAWSYYASIRKGVDPRLSRDPNFTAKLSMPTPFDWVPSDDAGVTAAILSGPKGGVFEFGTAPSLGGTVLEQLQILPPGEYRLVGRSQGVEAPESSQPYWLLRCSDGRELGRVPIPNSSFQEGRFVGRISVPAGCPVQSLSLFAPATETISGLTGNIESIQLSPAKVNR